MAAVSVKQRDEIKKLVETEEKMLLQKAEEHAGLEWAKAELELAERLGLSDNLVRAQHLREQIQAMQEELVKLESDHEWRSLQPTNEDFIQAGLRPPSRNQFGRMIEWSIPEVFQIKLDTKWKLEVFKIINERMNLISVQNRLRQVGASVRREIMLAANMAEIKVVYYKFFTLLVKAGGDEVPPLLSDIVEMPLMLPGADEGRL